MQKHNFIWLSNLKYTSNMAANCDNRERVNRKGKLKKYNILIISRILGRTDKIYFYRFFLQLKEKAKNKTVKL